MSGNLLAKARRDAKRFMQRGFSDQITLSTPSGNFSITTTGLASKHHINFDSSGLPINSKNAHVCLSESDLIEKNYSTRNAQKEVDLMNHKIDVKDSSGEIKNYVVIENFPDETLGLIVCILGDYGIN